MVWLLFLFVMLLLSPLLTAFNISHCKLYSGTEVVARETFNHVVSLRNATTSEHFCAGVIVSPMHVVTAAHCVYNLTNGRPIDADSFQVVAGQKKLTPLSSVLYNVSEVILDSKYNASDIHNDIAILKMETSFDLYNNRDISICPLSRQTIKDGSRCITSGWGSNTKFHKHLSNKLRYLDVTIITNNKCQQKYAPKDRILDNMICIKNLKNDIFAKGDSGGGLICDNMLVGIVSGSIVNQPGVFTRTSSYYDWIQSHVRDTFQ